MSSLTDQQRKMIEEKRKAAQAKLAAKMRQNNSPQPLIINSNNSYLTSKTESVSPSSGGKVVRINYNNAKSFTPKGVCGTCELISKDRFIVHVDYHQQLIDIFKTMPSKNYGE